LRQRDAQRRTIREGVKHGFLSEDAALERLAMAYARYSDLEYMLYRLIRNDGVFELWEQSRRAA